MQVDVFFGALDARYSLLEQGHQVDWQAGLSKRRHQERKGPKTARFVGAVQEAEREPTGDQLLAWRGVSEVAVAKKLATFPAGGAPVLHVPGWRGQARVQRTYWFQDRSLAVFCVSLELPDSHAYEIPLPLLRTYLERILQTPVRFPRESNVEKLGASSARFVRTHLSSSTPLEAMRSGRHHGDFVLSLQPFVIVSDNVGALKATTGFAPIRLGLIDYQFAFISELPVHVVRQSMLYRSSPGQQQAVRAREALASVHLNGGAAAEWLRLLSTRQQKLGASLSGLGFQVLRGQLERVEHLTSRFGRESLAEISVVAARQRDSDTWPFAISELADLARAVHSSAAIKKKLVSCVSDFSHVIEPFRQPQTMAA